MLKIFTIFVIIVFNTLNAYAQTNRNITMVNSAKNIGTYFEIPVTNLERAIKFYSSVFGCEFSRETMHGNEMALFPFNGKNSGITGALAKGDIYKPSISGTLIYLSTDDLDRALENVIENGGEVLFPKTKAGEYGFVAEFKDLEGNRIALFQSI